MPAVHISSLMKSFAQAELHRVIDNLDEPEKWLGGDNEFSEEKKKNYQEAIALFKGLLRLHINL